MDRQERDWEFATARPGIAPGVSSMVGYRTLCASTSIHRGLPLSRLTFILSLDEGVEAAPAAAGLATARPARVILAGLHLNASSVRQRRGQAGVQLAVHPLAARRLLGTPAAELSVTDFDGFPVVGPWAAELSERAAAARDWRERFAIVAAGLAGRFAGSARSDRVRPELVGAWGLLERSGGTLPIAEVSARVGLGTRQLGALFVREVGRSPKQIAGLMRFERTVAEISTSLRGSGRVDLGHAAAVTGYSDQAHLTREFHRYAGTSPSRWIAEELRNVQDGGHAAAADWDQ